MTSIAAQAMGLLVALLLLSPAPLRADPLPKVTGEVILTIDGAVTVTNGDGMAAFDLAMLESLPAKQLVTETPWTKGLHTFTGVPLQVLLGRVGAQGKTLTAVALDDYSADLPADDGERNGALVAYRFDGQPMLPSGHGPLWIVYPFTDREELRTESVYIRAVWNLIMLTVR